MEAFHGSWKINHEKTKNMEAFLQAAGFPEAMVKEFTERDWNIEYSAGSDGKLVTHVKILNRPQLPEKTYEITLGQEIELEGVDGDKTMSTVNWDGSKFVEHHKSVPGSPIEFVFDVTREIKANEMIFISTMKGVTLTEVYNKL